LRERLPSTDNLEVIQQIAMVRDQGAMALPASMTLPPPNPMMTLQLASRAISTPLRTVSRVGSLVTLKWVAAIPSDFR